MIICEIILYEFAVSNKNLALNGRTCQSSTYLMNNQLLYSWLAVDGLNGTKPLNQECTHTNDTAKTGLESWFLVQLKVMAKVVEVKVLVRYASVPTVSECLVLII